ncbi:monocarboxylate transporter 12-B-like [Strongylocentrotus purpuratus]|uniref:Uncharacterized protein n=1 Tax=Strongylocentrotus purpuratus TaxID=7668 RepID=A0A7M7PBI6_STRPU|nr:monocarboxylate transporter 12-B-like [Strongylocentrotus purpuratus]
MLQYMRVKYLFLISVVGSFSLVCLSLSSNATAFGVLALLAGVCYAFVFVYMVLRMCEKVVDGFALAYGIVNAGTAVGMMVLPIFTEFLHRTYGWRGTVAILGAISLHTSILVLWMGEPAAKDGVDSQDVRRQPEEHISAVILNEEHNVSSGSDVEQSPLEHLLDRGTVSSLDRTQVRLESLQYVCSKLCSNITGCLHETWKHFGLSILTELPYTLVLNAGFLVISLVNTAWVIYLIPHGVSKGFPLSQAVFLALYGSIGQCIGRVGQGLLVDRNWVTSVELTIICSIVGAFTLCLDPLFHNFEIICTLAFIGGLVNGARVSLTVVIVKQFIPRERFKHGYSLNCLFFGVGEPLGGIVAGYVANAFSFDIAYEVLGSFEILLSFALITTNYFITRTDTTTDDI